MARKKRKTRKLKHRTISYTIVGDKRGAPRERAFPLAVRAEEAADAGQCREAAIFLDYARKLGGGPVTENAARAVKSCRRLR